MPRVTERVACSNHCGATLIVSRLRAGDQVLCRSCSRSGVEALSSKPVAPEAMARIAAIAARERIAGVRIPIGRTDLTYLTEVK